MAAPVRACAIKTQRKWDFPNWNSSRPNGQGNKKSRYAICVPAFLAAPVRLVRSKLVLRRYSEPVSTFLPYPLLRASVTTHDFSRNRSSVDGWQGEAKTRRHLSTGYWLVVTKKIFLTFCCVVSNSRQSFKLTAVVSIPYIHTFIIGGNLGGAPKTNIIDYKIL